MEECMNKELSDMTLEELWKLFPIILKNHNADYKKWYAEEKQNIQKAVGEGVIERINHIGSSAVTGLISKPTIDILLEIKDHTEIKKVEGLLVEDGWLLMSAAETPYLNYVFNKGYTKEGFAEKVYHLHIRYLGDWSELYFKDYLIDHVEAANEYGKLKLELGETYKNNRDGYTKAKTKFVEYHTEKARSEYGSKYRADKT